jgi:hypothetical protein
MGRLSLLKLMLKDLPNARELITASREARRLTLYKLAETLGPEAKRPWHEWGERSSRTTFTASSWSSRPRSGGPTAA